MARVVGNQWLVPTLPPGTSGLQGGVHKRPPEENARTLMYINFFHFSLLFWVVFVIHKCITRTALTQYHKPEWPKQQEFILSRFWRLEVQDHGVSGVDCSWGCEGGSLPCLSPGCRWFAGNLWNFLACRCITPVSAFLSPWHSPCVCLCANVPFL